MGKRDANQVRTESGSLRSLARHIGVSEMAIRKRIKSGGMSRCLGKTQKGKPVIVDMQLAVEEWNASSKTGVMASAWGSHDRVTEAVASAGSRPDAVPALPPAHLPADEEPDDIDTVVPAGATTLVEAQRLATIQRERKLRLENDVFEGRLVHVDKVSKEAFEAERTIRENMLNLPARISGELAAETDAAKVYLRLDAAIREALNVTSDMLLAITDE